LIFLGFGIILCTYKKAKETFTLRWKIYTFFFLVFASSVGIVFKAFSKNEASNYSGDMMLVSATVMAVTYFFISLVLGGWRFKGQAIDKKELILFVGYALISGLFSCVYNRLNIYLTGMLDGVIFFPSFNGGVILLSTILSVLLIKERLQLKQVLGIFIGIVGICIIGVF